MLPAGVDSFRPAYLLAADELKGNREQWQAYEARGHCVILAGPGSGKTKTLTTKIARMLHEDVFAPRGVACITYSSECARELRQRLDRLGIQGSSRVFIGTVHSFCLKNVVVPYGRLAGLDVPADIVVASPTEQELLFEQTLTAEVCANEYPATWRTRMDEYRRTHLDRTEAGWYEDEQLARLVERYEGKLRAGGLLDFDDMVLLGLELVERHKWVRNAIRARFPILAVDEYQDLGVPLHRLVLSLCFEGRVRLLAVGDPDQSIYGFTGARPHLLKELAERADVESVRLRFNYRSGKTLVAAAAAALGEDRGYEARGSYIGTVDQYECPEGLEEQADLICDAIIPRALERRSGRALGDIAVLYVDKNDGDVIARKMTSRGLQTIRVDRGAPYPKTQLTRWLEECAKWCSGGWRQGAPRLSVLLDGWRDLNRSIRDEEGRYRLRMELVLFLFRNRVTDVMLRDWLRAMDEACLGQMFLREQAIRDEGEAFAKLTAACGAGGALETLTVQTFGGQVGSPTHVNLVTLHSAKGLEFDVVVMMGLEQGRIPRWSARSEDAKREARRLFYVGLTRARHEVHMTYSGWTENQSGRRFVNGPSEFIGEIEARLQRG